MENRKLCGSKWAESKFVNAGIVSAAFIIIGCANPFTIHNEILNKINRLILSPAEIQSVCRSCQLDLTSVGGRGA